MAYFPNYHQRGNGGNRGGNFGGNGGNRGGNRGSSGGNRGGNFGGNGGNRGGNFGGNGGNRGGTGGNRGGYGSALTAPIAPYHFIPFSDEVILRYQDPGELPGHDKIAPELLTGEIGVTMTADTPLILSTGKDNHNAFYKTADGRFALPGSSVRGMVRENMQILGCGLIRPEEDIQDIQIYYRDMTSEQNGRFTPLASQYRAVMVDQRTNESKAQGGFLYNNGGHYEIHPLAKPFVRLPRDSDDFLESGFTETYTKSFPIDCENGLDDIQKRYLSRLRETYKSQTWILFTGHEVGNPNSVYLFGNEGTGRLDISDEDILSYQIDYETRRNTLRGTNRDGNPFFWELPKKGEKKPVFYLCHNRHIYFGMSRFLRIGYNKKLTEGLPPKHQKKPAALDYTHAMLGYCVGQEAYRSRVSFTDLKSDTAEETEKASVVLLGPKPSFCRAYVQGGNNYNEEFRLNGFKRYWMKEAETALGDPLQKPEQGVRRNINYLPKDVVFSGVIRFRNLHPDELGLLLWSIRPEKEHGYQQIGGCKPLGFGRMKTEITSLSLYQAEKLYTSLEADASDALDGIDGYIRAYLTEAQKRLGHGGEAPEAFLERGPIRDFLYSLGTVRHDSQNVRYMTLKEHQHVSGTLKTVEQLRGISAANNKKG